MNTMVSRLLACPIGLLLMLLPVAAFAEVTPYPPPTQARSRASLTR